MSRNVRVALAVAVVAAGVIAVIAWRRGGETSAGATGRTGSGSGVARGSAGRDVVAPVWFGVPSVGDRRITGTVFLDTKPTPATLSLASAATDAGVTAVVDATAGADGRFDLGEHRAGTYRLFATAPGAVPRVVTVDCETRDADVQVFLDACKTTVGGDVRDASGGPIAGAVIATGGFRLATTDAAGRYELCLGSGGATLIARADGYAPSGRRIEEIGSGSVELDFDLVPDAIVSVRVVDPRKAPVAGALVQALLPDAGFRPDASAQRGLGVTGADGRLELRGLAPTTYQLLADAVGLTSQSPVTIEPIAGQAIDVTLELVDAVTITGTVREEGAPIAGMRLRWRVADVDRARTISADDGTFILAGVAPGAGTFAADSPDWVVNPEHVAVAGGPAVDVQVIRGQIVRGHVVRGSTPIGGAQVRFLEFGGDPVTSRADGAFALASSGVGELTIEAQSDMLGAFGTTKVNLESGKDVDGVIVDVEFGGVIAGVLVDQAGAPLAGASVRYDSDELSDYGAGVTRPDGTFVADKLRGGSPYVPTVQLEGGQLVAAAGTWPVIDVPANGRVDGVRLVARVDRVTVGGVLVDSKGAPVPDALIKLRPGPRETRTAVDGKFTLTSTNPGPFMIEARASGSRTARVTDVAAGTRDVRLILLDPGGLHVTCDPALVSSLRLLGGGPQGAFACGATIKPIPPGRYTVFADRIAEAVTVNAGAITELAVAPSPSSRVTVVVAGVPAANVMCGSWLLIEDRGVSIGEAPVAVNQGRVELELTHGTNRIDCSGDGASGEKTIEVGPDPIQVTVELERSRPDEE